MQAVLSHSQIERKVSVILSLLDFVGVLTKVDQTMHDLLKDLSHLANTKHIRVTRKAKQIAGSYQNNIAEQNKMVVLPALRQLSSAALSEEKEAEMSNVPAYERESMHGKEIAISVAPSSIPAAMRVTKSRIPGKHSR